MHKDESSKSIKGEENLKTNRYLLCLLLTGLMLYVAVPRLAITADGAQGIFSIVWLTFALFVAAGNLTALLYAPKKQAQKSQLERVRGRSYH